MTALAKPLVPAPAATSAAEVIANLQRTVSPSQLSLFLQCRLKFWFRYVERLAKPKTAALHVGSAVHAVLKAWNKARWRRTPLTLSQLYQEYARAWVESEEPVQWDNDEGEQMRTGWRLVETYFRESGIPESVKPDAVEVPVEADLHQHGLPALIGILDLVQQGRIIDFKTASTTPNPERVAHTTEVQTSSYAILYREATGQRETGIELHHLVKLKNPKLVITALPAMSDAQQVRLFRQIEAYVEGLERQDFVPSPGMQCVSCEFFNECRLWS
ncbi:MAG: PD-(D/E)XK nuclease family protein [Chthoniobacter sp.]|nr:PD-(D/E)XK nuclease family protein [Chthoniobacter sp.]